MYDMRFTVYKLSLWDVSLGYDNMVRSWLCYMIVVTVFSNSYMRGVCLCCSLTTQYNRYFIPIFLKPKKNCFFMCWFTRLDFGSSQIIDVKVQRPGAQLICFKYQFSCSIQSHFMPIEFQPENHTLQQPRTFMTR
jgi:hypothetical protein